MARTQGPNLKGDVPQVIDHDWIEATTHSSQWTKTTSESSAEAEYLMKKADTRNTEVDNDVQMEERCNDNWQTEDRPEEEELPEADYGGDSSDEAVPQDITEPHQGTPDRIGLRE